jgi:chromosome segregation ATPase
MIRKAIITALGVTLAAGFVFGTSLFSYLSTGYDRVTTRVEESVPMEFQIDRARKMVADLNPEIRNSMHVIAKEEVALDQLNERITQAETHTAKAKGEIMQLQSDLSDNKRVYHYAGRSYSASQVKEDLTRRFTRFKVDDETLAHLQQMRDARQANLDAARQKLTAMMSAQKNLETDIANLEAKHKLVEVAQASSDIVFDDSQLAQAKQLISEIRTRLDVAAKLANASVEVQAEIPLDQPAADDIVDQVTEYFERDEPTGDEVATASFHEEE